MAREKILLADNDPQMLARLRKFLKGLGYQTSAATNGHQVLDLLEAEEFPLALLELKLPGFSGLELLFLIKAHSPDTEMIIFTEYAELDSALQALRLGAYDYLVKSDLRLPNLQTAVARALEHRQLAQANRRLVDHLSQAQEELAQRRAAELSQIRHIGEALAGPLTGEQLFQGLLRLIWESLPIKVLGLEVHGGEKVLPREAYRSQEGVAEATLQTFKSGLEERLRLAVPGGPNTAARGPGLHEMPFNSMIWAQIRSGEVLVLIGAGREETFTPEEAELFRIFTLQGEAALKNLLLFEQVKGLAICDGLTGLYNYRFFWDVLQREVELGRRYGHPLSLLFLDIDDFKRVNDTWGHPVGDVVLKALSAYLRRTVRQVDLLCRYGGEEFVVLLPQTIPEQAMISAERLRRGIARLRPVPHQDVHVTVSIGVSGLERGISAEGLLKAADEALYRAKHAGKNRVCGLKEC